MTTILNPALKERLLKIQQEINSECGYHENIPRINHGPCGVFAKVFFDEWNALFENKVHICFVRPNKL